MCPNGHKLPSVAHPAVQRVSDRLELAQVSPESIRVIGLQQVAKLVHHDVTNQLAWKEQQPAIQADAAVDSATPPSSALILDRKIDVPQSALLPHIRQP